MPYENHRNCPETSNSQQHSQTAGALEEAPSLKRAKALEYLVDGKLVDASEVLKQIVNGAQYMLDSDQSLSTLESGTATLCKGIAEGLQDASRDFHGNERTCLLLGYLYGTLVTPNQEEHQRLVKTLFHRRARHSIGGKKGVRLTQEKRDQFRQEWHAWREQGAPGRKQDFDKRMSSLFNISEKLAEKERLLLQKSLITTA